MSRVLKLERMEIIGFKSFYGRTRFEFPDGITAVVGPNGCGKSNIGDAISWVLGEQKASALRSDRMEDVIFNGSDARRPLGMAEVSLHFRNLRAAASGNGGNGHAAAAGGNGHGGTGAAVVEPPAAPAPAGHDRVVVIPSASEAGPPAGAPIAGDATDPAAAGMATPSSAAEAAADGAPDSAPDAAGPAGGTSDPGAEGPRPRFFSLEDVPENVVVTRRVYRSGESEYILNGERCRLRDIQDLLARTDVGSRLYSTIEQGKIDQILAARPRDRRVLFEEAAGILGYKTRRRQAEAKLEATQANLLRIADIAAEVEKQIQSLKRQAARARRYQRLHQDLGEKRLLLARVRLMALEAERARAGEALAALRAEEAEAAAALGRDEAELESLRQRLEEGETAARQRREEIHALDLDLDRLAERMRAGGEQERDLLQRIATAAAEAEALATRAAGQETRCRALEEAAGHETAALREAEAAAAAAAREAETRSAGLRERESRLEEARGDQVRLLEEIAALERRKAALEEQDRAGALALERLRRHAAEQAAARDLLAAALAALDAEAAGAAERLAELERERADRAEEHARAAATLEEAERRAEERRGRETALAERLATLQRMTRERAGFGEAVRRLLEGAGGVAARGVAGERVEVPRGLERAVEAALGERLQAVLVDAAGDALRGVEHLRSSGSGRASFAAAWGAAGTRQDLPATLAAAPDVRGRLGDLVATPGVPSLRAVLDHAVLVETLAAAVDLQAAHPGWVFVTPQGDVVDRDGMVTGGDGRALDHGLLARRTEMEEVAAQAAAAGRELREAEEALPGLRAAAAERGAALAAATDAVRDAERAAFERDVARQQKAGEAARIDAATPVGAAEIERLDRAAAETVARRAALEAELAAAAARRRDLEAGIQAAGEDVAAHRAGLEESRRAAAGIAAGVAAGMEKVAGLRREGAALAAALAETRAALDLRRAEAGGWQERVAGIRAQADSLGAARRELQARRADAAARDEAQHAGLAYERSLLHAREQGVRGRRQAHADLQARAQERAVEGARLEARLDGLAASCRDELGTTLAALRDQGVPEDAPPPEALEPEIERLRADLDGIGPVNLMAIEQHGELEERFGFLSAQKVDLEESVASLQETIRRINRQTRERFREAFEAIQGYFLETFRTLFGGGRAELRLQDDEDVLEAGVEIVAQPPGKRLQKIALLSGGEKALTAAALLFSLFRYRPSPFCVLDEVDAPLDEANVERFTTLLKALRAETQFILITHNRKSMEAADLLYGVTMEEAGVSKVLPLRFE